MSLEKKYGKVYKIEEVADFLNCSPATVYNLAKRGKVGIKIGGNWRIKEKEIEELLEKKNNTKPFISKRNKKNINNIINKSQSIT